MATHNIMIYATKNKPYPLSIADDEGHLSVTEKGDEALDTIVLEGDTVIWTINSKSDITSIDSIDFDNPTDFLEKGPTKEKGNTGNWSCVIRSGKGVVNGSMEYRITYTVNGVPFIQDPKLQIRKKGIGN